MRFNYDIKFIFIAFRLPFNKGILKLSHFPMKVMLKFTLKPNGLKKKIIKINGYNNESISLIELTPKKLSSNGCILYLHGGGLGYGIAPYQYKYACKYAIDLGLKVYMLDYHLLPKYKFPYQVNDSINSIKYLNDNADKLNIDKNKIIVLGESAGGYLASIICNSYQKYNYSKPLGQVLNYPVISDDLDSSSKRKFIDTPLWNTKNNTSMWKLYECHDESYIPLKMKFPDELPSTYIELCEFDCLHDEGMEYYNRIKDLTPYIELNDTIGTFHGYDMMKMHPISKDSYQKRVNFMKKLLTE